MAEPIRFRSSSTRAIGVGTMAVAVIAIGSLVLTGEWHDLAEYAGPLGLVGLVGYAVLWLPYVEISEGGVELRNVLRSVMLPWPAIEEVDGRYGLRLTTAYGRFTSWAAPAPSGRDRLRGGDSEASALVRQQLDRLQALGHLDNPRLEFESADVTWNMPVILAAAALLVLAVLGPLLN